MTPLTGVAAELIAKRGMARFTLAELADAAAMPEPTVARQFASSEDAIAAVMREGEREFLHELYARLGDAPAAEKLDALIAACVSECDSTMWIELWSQALREPWAAELRQELDDEFRGVLAELIRAGQAEGDYRATDPDRAALILSSLLDGFAAQATLGDSRVTARYMHRACAWAAERLLGAPPGAKRGGA